MGSKTQSKKDMVLCPESLGEWLQETRKTNYRRAEERLRAAGASAPCSVCLKCEDNTQENWVISHDMLLHVDSGRFAEYAQGDIVIPGHRACAGAMCEAVPMVADLLAGFVPHIQAQHTSAIIHTCSYIGAEHLLKEFCEHLELEVLPNDVLLACAHVLSLHPFQASETTCGEIVEELNTSKRLPTLLEEECWKAVAHLGALIATFAEPDTVKEWLPSSPADPRRAAFAFLLSYGAATSFSEPAQPADPQEPPGKPNYAPQQDRETAEDGNPARSPRPAQPPPKTIASSSATDEQPNNEQGVPGTSTPPRLSAQQASATAAAADAAHETLSTGSGSWTELDAPASLPTSAGPSSPSASTAAGQPQAVKSPAQEHTGPGAGAAAERAQAWASLFSEHCTAVALAALPAATRAAVVEHAESGAESGGAARTVWTQLLRVLCAHVHAAPALLFEAASGPPSSYEGGMFGSLIEAVGALYGAEYRSPGCERRGDFSCRLLWVCRSLDLRSRAVSAQLGSRVLAVRVPGGSLAMWCTLEFPTPQSAKILLNVKATHGPSATQRGLDVEASHTVEVDAVNFEKACFGPAPPESLGKATKGVAQLASSSNGTPAKFCLGCLGPQEIAASRCGFAVCMTVQFS